MEQMKVVIVDDNKSAGLALAGLLEDKYGFEVQGIALCGLDGLALVSKCRPDVLFLDVQLPDVNGLDFLDKLSEFTNGSCRVIMFTAYDKYVLTAFRKRAFDVLLKPINPQELDTIVHRLQLEAASGEPEEPVASATLNGKLLFYMNTIDFKLVDKNDVCLFQYDHELRCWEVVVADTKRPIKLKRSVKSVDLLRLDSHFLQVNQKYIVNIDYLMEVVDGVCHFYPPFDAIDYVKVGRFFRKKLIERFLSI